MAETIAHLSRTTTFSPPPAELCVVSLGMVYDQYRDERRTLHQQELHNQDTAKQFRKVLGIKEGFAETAGLLHKASGGDPNIFSKHVVDALQIASQARGNDNVKAHELLFGAYCMPLSFKETAISNPIEASMVTNENLAIATEFSRIGAPTLTGLILSGTTDWGAFYATHGKRNPDITKVDIESRSDIDLTAIAKDIDAIGHTIETYITAGMISPKERQRFALFKKLHRQGKVDIFSIRSNYKDVEQSIHFLTHDMTEAITGIRRVHTRKQNGHRINYLRDFRPNRPNNPTKNGGGYSINDLKNLYKGRLIFRPEVTAVEDLGYISELPIGSVLTVDGQRTYAMGVLDFFFAIQTTLHDTDGWTAARAATMQHNIAQIQGTERVMNLPREMRMAKGVRSAIKNSLQLSV